MTLAVPTLQGDDLGPGSPNRQRVQEVRTLAGQCTDAVPFLLVPVRLQTRFVEAEVPVAGQPTATAQIAGLLDTAVAAAVALTGRSYASPVAGGNAKARRAYKKDVEAPLVAEAAANIESIGTAISSAQRLTRNIAEASPAEVEALGRAAARLGELLGSVATAIATVRSGYHREALTKAYAPVEAAAKRLLSEVDGKARPAADFFAALRDTARHAGTRLTFGSPAVVGRAAVPADRIIGRAAVPAAARIDAPHPPEPAPPRVESATARPVAMPRARLADSAEAYARLGAALDAIDAIAARPTAPGELDSALNDALAASAAIAVLPDAWRDRLVARVGDAATRLAATRPGDATTGLITKLGERTGSIPTTGHTGTGPDISVAATPTVIVDQLRIRILPDDFSVATHEPALTAAERDAGARYWTQTVDAGADDAARLAAWRQLAAAHGPNRAAWVARRTAPKTPPTTPAAVATVLDALATVHKRIVDLTATPGKRLDSLARALTDAAGAVTAAGAMAPATAERVRSRAEGLAAQIDALAAAARGGSLHGDAESAEVATGLGEVDDAFTRLRDALDATRSDPSLGQVRLPGIADADLKAAAWTMPPHAGLLPHRFVAVTVSGDTVSHVVAGTDVRPDLALGLDPRPENAATETPVIARDGTLVMGASLRWMTDYDEAVAAGMAITIPITPDEAAAGFDRVYVLGLAKGTDPAKAATALADQLDNHHYTPRGLALVPVGTPTNNTDTTQSGYRRAEDADASFAVETGPPLVTGAAGTPDGRRLATGLGVDATVFDHVAGADGHDIDDARTANEALWPATAGYALEELLAKVIPLAARDKIAAFATRHVLGRGSLPALRVGSQPYGVIPTIAYSRYQPSDDIAFQTVLRDVLLLMLEDWTAAAANVRHAYTPGIDKQDRVLSVLGLDAVAAAYVQRFAVNAGRDGIGFAWNNRFYPPNVSSTRIRTGPIALLQRFRTIFERTGSITPGPFISDKGAIAGDYAGVYQNITGSRAYEVTYVDTPAALTGGAIVAATPAAHSAEVTAILAKDLWGLAMDMGARTHGRTLAHLLLGQALLVQARDVALRILADEHIVDEALRARVGASDMFRVTVLGGTLNVTRWSFLLGVLGRFDGKLGTGSFGGSGLYGYLSGQPAGRQQMDAYLSDGGNNPVAQGYPGPLTPAYRSMLADHRAAVARFGALHPDAAARVTVEHLDTCAYRLDAWLLGLADRRLAAMRANAPTGVHLGAFGWIDDLRPNPRLKPAANLPAMLNTDPSRPIYHDDASEGFIHAPSPAHAATAAIMRAGYLAHAGGTQAGTQMSVNVSSRRVRAAFALLDGVSAGNDLGALLGYQFERDLHDAADRVGVILDDLIAPLRLRFPSVASVDGSADLHPSDARYVVDGLALLTAVQDDLAARQVPQPGTLLAALCYQPGYPGWPYGITPKDPTAPPLLPAKTETVRLDAVLRAVDRLADTVDAIADLVLTEGTHQIVQGNHPRAAAILSALGAGKAPARPEVADTPVAGALISHRVLLHLTPGAAKPAGWTAASPRADAEPALNAWLGELIGPPGQTRARVVTDTGEHAADVSLTDLEIQPIDLLAMLRNGLDDAMTELSVRILDTLRPLDVRDGTPAPVLRVSLERGPDWPPAVRSLADTCALVEAVAIMMRGTRPATSADYVLAEAASPGGAGADSAELAGRVAAATTALTDLGGRLVALVSDGADTDLTALGTDPAKYVAAQTDTYRVGAALGEHMPGLDRLWARRNEFRAALLAAMGFGIRGIVLPDKWETRDQVAATWLGAAESALLEVARRLQAAAAVSGADVGAHLARATAVFTDTLPVIPRFALSNPAEVAAAVAAPPADEPALSAERWLTGVSAVRENVAAYTLATTLADAFGTAVPDAMPVQFPVVAGEPWVGEAAPTAPGSRISLLLLAPDRLDTGGMGTVAALCVDMWDEIIPAGARTTGVAFHYDQPDSEPPQALLLAVPPAVAGAWRWEDLIQTLHDTLELARIRTVEPEHLQDDVYGELLPLIIGEQEPWDDEEPDPSPAASDHRVFLDFGAIVPSGGPQ